MAQAPECLRWRELQAPLAWPNTGCCRHWGNKPEISLCLSFLPLSFLPPSHCQSAFQIKEINDKSPEKLCWSKEIRAGFPTGHCKQLRERTARSGKPHHTPSTRSSGLGTAACFFWLRALWEVTDSLRVFIINPESVVTPEPDTEKYIVHRSSSAILAQWQKQISSQQGRVYLYLYLDGHSGDCLSNVSYLPYASNGRVLTLCKLYLCEIGFIRKHLSNSSNDIKKKNHSLV